MKTGSLELARIKHNIVRHCIGCAVARAGNHVYSGHNFKCRRDALVPLNHVRKSS
jgi:hypothetical protein